MDKRGLNIKPDHHGHNSKIFFMPTMKKRGLAICPLIPDYDHFWLLNYFFMFGCGRRLEFF